MKLITLSFLFAVAIADSDHNLNGLPMSSKVYGKAKKVPGSSSAFEGTGFTCPTDCLTTMNTKIAENPELKEFTTKQSEPYIFEGQFDKQKLTKYCQIINQTKACLGICSDSPMKGIADKTMLGPKYSCIDTKFVEYAPCYDKVTKVNEKVCHAANQCGGKKAALVAEMMKPHNSVAEIENLLKHKCEYFVCFHDCDRPKMTQECGAEATRVLEGMYKNNLNVMEGVFLQMGLQITMPPVCNRVGVQG